MSQSWIRKLFGLSSSSRKALRRGQNRKVDNKARLSLENLEDRFAPAITFLQGANIDKFSHAPC